VKRSSLRRRLLGGVGASLHTRGALLWGAALAIGIFCVWEHVCATRLASDIERLKVAKARAEAELGFLEMECAALSSRERVEGYAKERLDMRYPATGEVVWIGSDGRELGDAEPQEFVEGERVGSIDG